MARRAFDFALAFDLVEALAHVAQAVALALGDIFSKAFAVIFDFHGKLFGIYQDAEAQIRRG
jgi:hypothetical protein